MKKQTKRQYWIKVIFLIIILFIISLVIINTGFLPELLEGMKGFFP